MHGDYIFLIRKFIAIQGLFYFVSGMCFSLGYINLRLKKAPALIVLICGICLMLIKIILHLNDLELYKCFGWMSVPFLLVGGWNLMPSYLICSTLISYAFPVYVVHMFFIYPLQCAGLAFPSSGIPTLGFVSCIVFAISSLAIFLARRFMPKTCAILFGNR